MLETQEQQEKELSAIAMSAVKALLLLNTIFIVTILNIDIGTIVTDTNLAHMHPSNILFCFILSLAFLVLQVFAAYVHKWCHYKVTIKNWRIWYVPGKTMQFITTLSAILSCALTLSGFAMMASYFYDDNLTIAVILPLMDYGLYGFHIFIIVFNLFGWITMNLRRFHRWIVSITAICWLGLGQLFDSIGYCPLTDWHWAIKKQLGEEELPNSFITLLINQAGYTPEPAQVDLGTGIAFGVIVIITLFMWWHDSHASNENKGS